MSFNADDPAPVELEVNESVKGGKRRIEGVDLVVFDSTPREEFGPRTDNWPKGQSFKLTWPEFLSLHKRMTERIEFIQPLLDAGAIEYRGQKCFHLADEICKCSCHEPGSCMLHCRPCCTTCPECGDRLTTGK